jgi:hypothetical protein
MKSSRLTAGAFLASPVEGVEVASPVEAVEVVEEVVVTSTASTPSTPSTNLQRFFEKFLRRICFFKNLIIDLHSILLLTTYPD